MLKPVAIGAAAVGLLAWAPKGYGSGSTRVEVTSESFRLVLETPRKIFEDSRGETEYHREAKKRLSRQLEVLKPLVEGAVEKLRSDGGVQWRLRRFEAELPVCPEETEAAEPIKNPPACRYVIPLAAGVPLYGLGSVEVAFNTPPPAAKERVDLKERLQKAIREGYRQPDDA